MAGARVTTMLKNILNDRLRVPDTAGLPPLGYAPDLLDLLDPLDRRRG